MNQTLPASDRVTLDFTRYGLTEVPLVGRYAYTHAHPPLRKHLHHDAFEVCLLQRGTQTYMIGKQRFALSAGDMIITRPGEVHGTDTEPENRGRLYWIQFLRPARNQPFLGLTPHSARLLLEPLSHLPRHQFHNCDVLFGTFERILAPPTSTIPKALFRASIQNLLLRLILDILILTGRETSQSYSAGVRQALQKLNEQSEEPLTLAQVASAAGTSESYLKTHFKREVGMTTMEYLMWLRIEKAKRALRESAIPVTELALQSGFATSQHFATVFKRLTGATPRDYRLMTGSMVTGDKQPSVGTGPLFHPIAPQI